MPFLTKTSGVPVCPPEGLIMIHPKNRSFRLLGLVAAAALLLTGLAVGVVSSGDRPVTALEPGTGLPNAPRTDTPRFIGGTIWDQAQVGNMIVVAGSFEQVRDTDGTLIDQPYLAAYDIDSGGLIRSFDTQLNKEVLTVEPDGAGGMIIGGKFNLIDGFGQQKLARLTATGEHDQSFRAEANAKVSNVVLKNGRVYVGGPFSSVKARGTWHTRERLAAFMLDDGSLDTAFDFPVTGPAGRGGDLSIKGLGFSGDRLIVSHSGLEVAGERRVGAAIIETTPLTAPTLSSWQTDFYDVNAVQNGRPLANTEMAVAPSGEYFVVVASGGDRPAQGNDAAVRFPVAGGAGVQPDWISRHFDSMFAVGITDRAVFVGGHFQFQEAPGSTNPYPGDPTVNYGAGGGGTGAAILGNEVVARQQIGALDPATGKSLNWNPGATAEIGVESLVPIDRGLLVGQDGDTLGGLDIGRHGFFDVTVDVAPPQQLDTTITSHFNGEVVDSGSVQLGGVASDTESIERVQLAIRHLPTGTYLQSDGTLGEWVGLSTDLTTPGGTTSDWTQTLTFTEPGRYSVQAKTFASDKRKDQAPAVIELDVRAAGDALPELQWNGPVVIDGRTVTATGVVSDDRGVARVTVQVQAQESNLYLQADGTMGVDPFNFDAELSAPNAPDTTYSFTTTVPEDGRYTLLANPFDTAGQDDQKFEQKAVLLSTENLRATLETNLATGEVPANGRLTITGTAADAEGIAQLKVRIYDQAYLTGVRPDNTFGDGASWTFIREAEGQTAHDFTYTSPPLPTGTYVAMVEVRDDLLRAERRTALIEVGPVGDSRPAAVVDVVDRRVYETTESLSVAGTATDDTSIDRVEIFVYNLTTRRWVNADGTYATSVVSQTADLESPGADSTRFSWTFVPVHDGRYRVWALAVDDAGQRANVTNAAKAIQDWTPDDLAPTIGRTSPEDDAELDGQIFLTGRAEDETAVTSVRVAIRNSSNKWLRTDGTFGGYQLHQADLTNPDRPGTNWDYASPQLPPDRYLVRIEAVDSFGKVTREQFFVTVI